MMGDVTPAPDAAQQEAAYQLDLRKRMRLAEGAILGRAPEHDLFGLGVLIFQLLMEGTHPFAGVFKGRGEPPVLEQRIGRLDRIGQTADINIHVPYLPGSAGELWARWYHEGLGAFEQTLHGAAAVFREYHGPVSALAAGGVPDEDASVPAEDAS